LISDFARTTNLKVISHTSVIKYKDGTKSIPQIAAELNVGAVIEGSVQRSADQVRVDVRLIDATTDRPIWAQKYEREAKGILALQSDIASAVARQVAVQVERPSAPDQFVVVSPEAYDAYLKGRFYWNKGGEENLLRSVTYYEQALEIEPRFAQALAGLADAHNFLALFGFGKPEEHFLKAREAARRAVATAPDLAETHAALAFNLMYADWNWDEAEREFRLALELEPARAITHHWSASLYSLLNRHEEALAEAHEAHRLDPLSPNVNSDLAWYYYYARRFEEAIRLCHRTLELDPSSTSMTVCLQLCYQFTNQPDSAVAELTRALEREQRPQAEIDEIRRAFTQGGLRKMWHQYVKALEHRANIDPPRFYQLTLGYALQGETDKAFYWIGQAFENRLGWVPFIGADPGLDGLRRDARFQTLLKRLRVANQDPA
jgi:tetratricopeptide (TPR) repeat protein